MSNPEEKDQGLLYVVIGATAGLAVLGVVYLRFRTANDVATLTDHAAVGNAMAPAVAFLTLLAVVAALWSVQIQRTELALQRKELQSTREEMVEQRKQFERTAKAQEALASSQAKLASQQARANYYSRRLVTAQRLQAYVALRSEILRTQVTVATAPTTFGGWEAARRDAIGNLEAMTEMLKTTHVHDVVDEEADIEKELSRDA